MPPKSKRSGASTPQSNPDTSKSQPANINNPPFSAFLSPVQPPLFSLDQQPPTTDSLLRFINTSALPFGVSHLPNDPCGRRVFAKQDIPAGTTILCEKSPLWVIDQDNLPMACSACGCTISQEALTNGSTLSDPSGFYTFCSTACQTVMKDIYTLEQYILPTYEQTAEQLHIDVNLLRLAIRFLIVKYLAILRDQQQQQQHATTTDESSSSPVAAANSTPLLCHVATTGMVPNLVDMTSSQSILPSTVPSPSTPSSSSSSSHPTATSHDVQLDIFRSESPAHISKGLPILQPAIAHINSLQTHAQHQNDTAIIATNLNAIKVLFPLLQTFADGAFLSTLYSAQITTQSQPNATTLLRTDETNPLFVALRDDLLHITGRINANIHCLENYLTVLPRLRKDPSTGQMDYTYTPAVAIGMGLFPIAAMFNHSCAPNCVFVNQGMILCIRTIAPIAQGEEVFVNYIPLDQDVISRRKQLLREKAFWCQCTRCMNQIPIIGVGGAVAQRICGVQQAMNQEQSSDVAAAAETATQSAAIVSTTTTTTTTVASTVLHAKMQAACDFVAKSAAAASTAVGTTTAVTSSKNPTKPAKGKSAAIAAAAAASAAKSKTKPPSSSTTTTTTTTATATATAAPSTTATATTQGPTNGNVSGEEMEYISIRRQLYNTFIANSIRTEFLDLAITNNFFDLQKHQLPLPSHDLIQQALQQQQQQFGEEKHDTIGISDLILPLPMSTSSSASSSSSSSSVHTDFTHYTLPEITTKQRESILALCTKQFLGKNLLNVVLEQQNALDTWFNTVIPIIASDLVINNMDNTSQKNNIISDPEQEQYQQHQQLQQQPQQQQFFASTPLPIQPNNLSRQVFSSLHAVFPQGLSIPITQLPHIAISSPASSSSSSPTQAHSKLTLPSPSSPDVYDAYTIYGTTFINTLSSSSSSLSQNEPLDITSLFATQDEQSSGAAAKSMPRETLRIITALLLAQTVRAQVDEMIAVVSNPGSSFVQKQQVVESTLLLIVSIHPVGLNGALYQVLTLFCNIIGAITTQTARKMPKNLSAVLIQYFQILSVLTWFQHIAFPLYFPAHINFSYNTLQWLHQAFSHYLTFASNIPLTSTPAVKAPLIATKNVTLPIANKLFSTLIRTLLSSTGIVFGPKHPQFGLLKMQINAQSQPLHDQVMKML